MTDVSNIYVKYHPSLYKDFHIIKKNVKNLTTNRKKKKFSPIKYKEVHKVLKILDVKLLPHFRVSHNFHNEAMAVL